MVDHPAQTRTTATLSSDSPEQTRALAAGLGGLCRGGEVLLLRGDLGSGKTCFVQGLAVGLGVPETLRVTSPTFTLHAEYPGRLVLNHLDLYRLEDPAALEGLGIEDMAMDPGAVLAVEWPELLLSWLRDDLLEIAIADAGNGRREFALTALGNRHARLLADWAG